jgi:thiosulfate/3-mercaptopyruvate sulfurtransferase
MMDQKLGGPLVSTSWLAEHLRDSDLRIFDCTVHILFDGSEGIATRAAHREYEAEHIPGAAFVDMVAGLSDRTPGVPYMMMPPADLFSRALSAVGLGDEFQVVIYSAGELMWATRLWWMLRASGFTNAAVLDGGLQQWKVEGRPLAVGVETHPPSAFTARPDAACWADKELVLAEIGSSTVCTVNALSRDDHLGTGELSPWVRAAYGRQGRIPGSLNVPYGSLTTEEGLFAPLEQLRHAFAAAGVLDHDRIILYCGAGLGSTVDALALTLIGCDNVAIYDGSLNEWGWDDSLPMETG